MQIGASNTWLNILQRRKPLPLDSINFQQIVFMQFRQIAVHHRCGQ